LLGDDVTDHRRIGGDDGGAGGVTRTDVFGEGGLDGALDVGMKFVQDLLLSGVYKSVPRIIAIF
jgi:hypothetical protein